MGLSLADVDEALLQAEESSNVAMIGPIFVRLLERGPDLTLAFLEKRLRELKLKMHLIAAPVSQLPNNMPPGVAPFQVGGKLAKHWLWIELHGNLAAWQALEKFNIPSPAENLARLRDTGFLMLPKGT